MNAKRDEVLRDLLATQYLDALDRGDLESVASLWQQAADDPALERALCDLSDGILSEEGPSADFKTDALRVKALSERHLSGRLLPEHHERPLTVGDVAANLQADAALGARLSKDDRTANARLLTDATPVPDQLSQSQLVQWTSRLGVKASASYWRSFRQAAVLLAMGRSQQSVELAAARQAGRSQKGKQP